MVQIGILLIILGFGSLILEQFDMEFRLLSWAYDMQPVFGIVLGLIGVALIVGALLMKKKAAQGSPSTGNWVGDGQWAGSAPSAPHTSGPLNGATSTTGAQLTGPEAQRGPAPGSMPGAPHPTFGGPSQPPAPGQPGIAPHSQQGQYGQRPPQPPPTGPTGPTGLTGSDRPQQGPGFGQQPPKQ